jgi:hypothetical protein
MNQPLGRSGRQTPSPIPARWGGSEGRSLSGDTERLALATVTPIGQTEAAMLAGHPLGADKEGGE